MKKRIITLLCVLCVSVTFTLPASVLAADQQDSAAADTLKKTLQTAHKKNKVIKYKGRNATQVPVITYHMLCSAKEKKLKVNKNDGLTVSLPVFKKQMKWLHKHGYTTLSMEEFYLWHEGKIKVPRKSVVITFDDGKYSVIKYALPVLKKYKMKGTAFIIGSYTPTKTKKYPKPNGRYYTIGKDVMEKVAKTYPKFEFQSHTYAMHGVTHKHPYARSLSLKKQKADFKQQYDTFGFNYLAYPYGIYTNKTIKAAKANHIKMAFSYGSDGFATKKQSRYKIKRIKISALRSMHSFYKWFPYK